MCLPINPVCQVKIVVGAVGAVGGKVAGSVFNTIAKAFADSANKITEWMWTVIAQTTTVDLSGGWFKSTLGITTTLAGLVIVALFTLELIKGVLRREPAALHRAVVGVGGGLLGAAASVGVVTVLLSATDRLSDGIVQTTGNGAIDTLGRHIAPTAALSSVGSPALMLILGLGYMLASFFVWCVFIARKAMLIVAAVFAPVAFAGAATKVTAGWVRKWVEFTLSMIFAKLVVVIIFTLSISLVGSPGKGFAAVGNLFSGLAMLIIACFAPWLLFRLIHFVGGDVIAAHHQGMIQSTTHAGSTPTSLARSGAAQLAGVVGAGAAGGAAAGFGASASRGAGTGGTAPAPAAQSGPPGRRPPDGSADHGSADSTVGSSRGDGSSGGGSMAATSQDSTTGSGWPGDGSGARTPTSSAGPGDSTSAAASPRPAQTSGTPQALPPAAPRPGGGPPSNPGDGEGRPPQ